MAEQAEQFGWVNAVKANSRAVDDAIKDSLPRFKHKSLKPAQCEAIRAVLSGKDAFVSVPTGYGKSLIYHILPFCAAKLMEGTSVIPCVLVLSPLTALMYDQNRKLNTDVVGAKSVLLAKDQLDKSAVVGMTHIFASPEALLDTEKGRSLLLNECFAQSLVAVAIDEAHCIVKW